MYEGRTEVMAKQVQNNEIWSQAPYRIGVPDTVVHCVLHTYDSRRSPMSMSSCRFPYTALISVIFVRQSAQLAGGVLRLRIIVSKRRIDIVVGLYLPIHQPFLNIIL